MSDQDWSEFLGTGEPQTIDQSPASQGQPSVSREQPQSNKEDYDWSDFLGFKPPAQPPQPHGEFAPVVNPFAHPADFLRVLAAQSSFNPEEQAQIFHQTFPDAEFTKDAEGNPLIRRKGGEWKYINEPGVSASDVISAGVLAASAAPALRMSGLAGGLTTRATPTLLGSISRNAAAEGVLQSGLELAQKAAGGNVDYPDIAGASLGSSAGVIATRAMLPVVEDVVRWMSKLGKNAAGSAGQKIRMIDKVREHMSGGEAIKRAYGPDAEKSAALSSEFGIPYTRGQYINSKVLQGREENILKGGTTEAAQRKLGRFVTEDQIPSEHAAVKKIQGDISGGSTIIEEPVEAGGRVVHKVHDLSDRLWNKIDEAFNKVGHANLDPGASKGLYRRLIRIAKVEHFETDKEIAPLSGRAMKIIAEGANAIAEDSKPVALRKLNTMRRRLLRLREDANKRIDRRQLNILIKGLDDRLDRAGKKGLFSGDPQSLMALRNANSLRRKYGDLFGPRDAMRRSGRKVSDKAGQFIEDIAEGNPNAHEVINAIFGAHSLYKRGGPEIIDRLKKVIGKEEWDQLRQAAFLKLFGRNLDKAKHPPARIFIKNLRDPANRQVLGKFFSHEELSQMNRLGEALLRAQPELQNPSGTGAAVSQLLHRYNLLHNRGLTDLIFNKAGEFVLARDAANALSIARPLAGVAGRIGSISGRTYGVYKANQIGAKKDQKGGEENQ